MEPVKNEPLPSPPDVALCQEKFRANVQTIRKSVAVTLGVPLLMFLGSCFLMNHDTYQPVFFFCLIVKAVIDRDTSGKADGGQSKA